ncbi:Uncharacterized protein FKW44_011048, partial [Caligus rogercresseyi]
KESPLREYGSHGSLDVLSRMDPPPMAVSTLVRKGTGVNGAWGAGRRTVRQERRHTLTRRPLHITPITPTTLHPHQSPRRKTFSTTPPSLRNSGVTPRSTPRKTPITDLPSGIRFLLHQRLLLLLLTSSHHDTHVVGLASLRPPAPFQDPEDRHRRRFFAHYDIASVCASLSPSGHLKTLERRNTTTGASAASAALRHSRDTSSDASPTPDADQGDHISNSLVLR